MMFGLWECVNVADYKTMYFQLAAKIADAVELLIKAQREGEALYMEENESIVQLDARKEEQTIKKKSDGRS